MKDAEVFLRHILESIKLLEKYLKGVSKETFLNSTAKQDLAARRLEIIGEAVKNLPPFFQKKNIQRLDGKKLQEQETF